MNRPGGNVTGVTLISGEIASKRIALLRDLLPVVRRLGVLMNSTTPASEAEAAVAERAAQKLGWQVNRWNHWKMEVAEGDRQVFDIPFGG